MKCYANTIILIFPIKLEFVPAVLNFNNPSLDSCVEPIKVSTMEFFSFHLPQIIQLMQRLTNFLCQTQSRRIIQNLVLLQLSFLSLRTCLN